MLRSIPFLFLRESPHVALLDKVIAQDVTIASTEALDHALGHR